MKQRYVLVPDSHIEQRSDDLSFNLAAEEFRSNMHTLSALEKSTKNIQTQDIQLLARSIDRAHLENLSPDLLSPTLSDISDKTLSYILLENGISRKHLRKLMNGLHMTDQMSDIFDETMLDDDPNLAERLAQSFIIFERMATKFTLLSGFQNSISKELAGTMYTQLQSLRDAISFFDVYAEYA